MISFLINLVAILGFVKILNDLIAASPFSKGLEQRLHLFFKRWQASGCASTPD
jgi:hypothetical protein